MVNLTDFLAIIEPLITVANIILGLALVYYVYLAVVGGTEGRDSEERKRKDIIVQGKGLWDKWFGKEAKTKRHAKREKTTALNEYIDEKKEVELINNADTKLKEVVGLLSTTPLPTVPAVKKEVGELTTLIKDVSKETSRLKRATFKQERQSKLLLDDLSKAGIKDKKLKEVKALENEILLRHDKVIKAIETIESLVKSGIIDKISKNPSKKPVIPADATALKSALGTVQLNLNVAKIEQERAYKATEGFIAGFKKYWEE